MRISLLVWLALAAAGARQTPKAPAAKAKASASAKQGTVTTRYDVYFKKYTKRFFGPTFDWRYFKAQSMAESDLIPTARSHVGARGLMQLMPSTYKMIASVNQSYTSIDDPQSNIGAGIQHDRGLWNVWKAKLKKGDHLEFMFGSYNSGELYIIRARKSAQQIQLDPNQWESVVVVAPKIEKWRYRETLGYVTTIEGNYEFLAPGFSAYGPVAAPTPSAPSASTP